jgi:acetyltransferase
MLAALQALLRPAEPAAQTLRLPSGESLVLRAIGVQDADAQQVFVRSLSQNSRFMRFHIGIRELSPDLLRAMTDVDPRRHVALVAQHGDAIVADARYVLDEDSDTTAEFALAVADEWQGRGLGRRLLAHMAAHARARGLVQLYGDILHENRRMIALMREAGARFRAVPGDGRLTRAVIDLAQGSAQAA